MALELKTAEIDCTALDCFLCDGSCVSLDFLTPIRANAAVEKFLPFDQQSAIYVRKDMIDVFIELTKSDRKQRQVLIGSPGVGKSILLFMVALYRARQEGKPVVYIRKTRRRNELTSLFFIFKKDDARTNLTIRYNRSLSSDWTVNQLQDKVLQQFAGIQPTERPVKIVMDEVLVFIDGLHEGDQEIKDPHHYLATSGGHDSLEGESGIDEDLVVLGGWQKESMGEALELTSQILTRTREIDAVISTTDADELASATADTAMETNKLDETVAAARKQAEIHDENPDAVYKQDTLDDLFFHTGGRIREAFSYSRGREAWKEKKKAMVEKISKAQVVICLIETKSSGDPKSPDRIRTMFRNDDDYFGSALQIVDSQYYVRLLRDRVELEQYYNAYIHARNRGLSCASDCHFEELLHHAFLEKLPHPIVVL